MRNPPHGARLGRRRLLGASFALGLGGVILKAGARPRAAGARAPPPRLWGRARPAAAAPPPLPPLVGVWNSPPGGGPNPAGARLRDLGLGIVLKTHDGLQ